MPIDPRRFLICDVASVPPVRAPLHAMGTFKWMIFSEHAFGMCWAYTDALEASPSGMVMAQGASDADKTCCCRRDGVWVPQQRMAVARLVRPSSNAREYGMTALWVAC